MSTTTTTTKSQSATKRLGFLGFSSKLICDDVSVPRFTCIVKDDWLKAWQGVVFVDVSSEERECVLPTLHQLES